MTKKTSMRIQETTLMLALSRINRRPQEVITRCNELLQLYPNSGIYLTYRGEASRQLGNNLDAMQDLNLALNVEPHNRERLLALYNRGALSFEDHNYTQAIADLTEVFQNNPQEKDVASLLGKAYCHLNDLEQGLKYLNSALEQNNSDLVALFYRVLAHMNMKNFTNAIIDANTYLSFNQNTEVMWYRANSFFYSGNYSAAINDFEQLVESSSHNIKARYLLGLSHYYLEEYEKGIEQFNTLLDNDHHNFTLNSFLYRGKCFFKLKRYELSTQDFNKILEKKPSHLEAIYCLGNLNHQTRNFERALEYLELALTIQPQNRSIQLLIASCHREIQGYLTNIGRDVYRHTRTGSDMYVGGEYYNPHGATMSGGSEVRFFRSATLKEFVVKKPHDYHHELDSYRTEYLVWNLLYPEYPARLFEFEHQDFRLVLPILPGVTLKQFQDSITPLEYLQIYLSLATELNKLHRYGYIHGDLKRDNILIYRDPNTGQFKVRIIDFGSSCKIGVSRQRYHFNGRRLSQHLPPELFSATNINAEKELINKHPGIDVFSFCRIILNNQDLLQTLSPALKDTLLKGKSDDPLERPSLSFIIQAIKENIANLTDAPALPAPAPYLQRPGL